MKDIFKKFKFLQNSIFAKFLLKFFFNTCNQNFWPKKGDFGKFFFLNFSYLYFLSHDVKPSRLKFNLFLCLTDKVYHRSVGANCTYFSYWLSDEVADAPSFSEGPTIGNMCESNLYFFVGVIMTSNTQNLPSDLLYAKPKKNQKIKVFFQTRVLGHRIHKKIFLIFSDLNVTLNVPAPWISVGLEAT